MPVEFRVIDTGVREGRLQIAFDQALIELHGRGKVPDTIRFLRFPPTVLIGRHQALSHEVRLDYCRAHGIGLVRRVTGGGAIYLDEGQVGWELVFRRSSVPLGGLGEYAQAICEGVAQGLSDAFGIDARFRPRNDIEVEGRKLSGSGGFFDGDTLIYQGTVLVDLDPERIAGALNVPEAKLKKRALDSAASRVVTLKALLGETPRIDAVHDAIIDGLSKRLNVRAEWGAISPAEEELACAAYDEEIGTDAFVNEIDAPEGAGVRAGTHTGAGGTVSAYLRLEGPAQDRIREVLFTGDFFLTPPRLIYDLEACLRGVPIAEAGGTLERFFRQANVDMLTITPQDFRSALESAIAASENDHTDARSAS